MSDNFLCHTFCCSTAAQGFVFRALASIANPSPQARELDTRREVQPLKVTQRKGSTNQQVGSRCASGLVSMRQQERTSDLSILIKGRQNGLVFFKHGRAVILRWPNYEASENSCESSLRDGAISRTIFIIESPSRPAVPYLKNGKTHLFPP